MAGAYKSIDFFAGIGGIRSGFEKKGFETVFAVDNDKHCKVTHDANFDAVPLTLGSIRDINADELPEFDIALAGFPCQPFSAAGQKQGFEDEERGNAFFQLMKVIEAKNPSAVFLENVKHLRAHGGGQTYRAMKDKLRDRGYSVTEAVLNSMNHGNVPQNRERFYIVAFKSPIATETFRFPDKIDLTKRVADLLEAEVDSKYYYREGWLYDRVKDDVGSRDYVYLWRRTYLRRFGTRDVCSTLTANMGMGGHNVPLIRDNRGIRRLTPRECCRLQGFEDSFRLPESVADGHLYKQIGNSVSVPVVARIAGCIKRALDNSPRANTNYGGHVHKKKEKRNNVANTVNRYANREDRIPILTPQ